MPETITPLSTREIGIPKGQLITPQGIDQFKQEAQILPNDDREIEKSNFENYFAKILNLSDADVFDRDETLKRGLPNVARNPRYLKWAYIFVDDCRLVLQESVDAPEELKQAAVQQLKDLQIVTKLCGLENPPQFTQQEEETYGKDNLDIVKKTWEERWPEIKAVFDTYIPPTTEEIAAQTDRQQLPTSDVGTQNEGVVSPPQLTAEEQRRLGNEKLFADSLSEFARRSGISEDEAYKLWLESEKPPEKPVEPAVATQGEALEPTESSSQPDDIPPFLRRARTLDSADIQPAPPVVPVESRSLPEATTFLGGNSPLKKTAEALSPEEREQKYRRQAEEQFILDRQNSIDKGYTVNDSPDYRRGAIEMNYIYYKGTNSETNALTGMTGIVEFAKYHPNGFIPKGLGLWIPQRHDLEEKAPPIPGKWIQEPLPGQVVAVKVSKNDPQARGDLSHERSALIELNNVFADDSWDFVRPARLLGYAVGDSGNPAIILERIDDPFKRVDTYLVERGSLSEKEALKIGSKLALFLSELHKRGILHNDINGQKLDNFYWDPVGGRVRIIDFGNTVDKKTDIGQAVASSFHHDRIGLVNFMLKLMTLCNEHEQLTEDDWAKITPETRKILQNVIVPPDSDPLGSFVPTTQLYIDLQKLAA